MRSRPLAVPGCATLQRHAWLGDWLPWIFLVLAVWRLGIQLFGFMAGMRGLYLIFAILAALAISYQGYLGGQLVYDYGIGTALYNTASSSPMPQPEATGPATPIPTVYVPAASATPEAAVPTTAAPPKPRCDPTPSVRRDPSGRHRALPRPLPPLRRAHRLPPAPPKPTRLAGSSGCADGGGKRMERRKIGVVSALFRYPVKSMFGESPAELALTTDGTLGDRAWAVREASGRIATAKKFAAMFGFRASYDSTPRADSLAPVTIAFPDGASIHAADPDASARLSEALGRPVTLERAKADERSRGEIDPQTIFADRSGRTASARP